MKGCKKIILTLLLALIIGGAIYGTYAKYISTASGDATLTAAKWNVKVNEELLGTTDTDIESTLAVILDESSNVVDGKIAPGRGGYFTVEIDPSDTEVAVEWAITLGSATGMPAGMAITGYKINDEELVSSTNPSGTIALHNDGGVVSKLTVSDKKTVKVYVAWEDAEVNNTTDTTKGIAGDTVTIPVNVSLSQKTA